MRMGIISGGNWIIDHVKRLDTWPPQGDLAHIGGRTAGNGGGPYNVLKDLAKLGAPFPLEAVGLLGDDADATLPRTRGLRRPATLRDGTWASSAFWNLAKA